MTTLITPPTRSVILDATHGIIRKQLNVLVYLTQRAALALEADWHRHQPAERWSPATTWASVDTLLMRATKGNVESATNTWIVVQRPDILTSPDIRREPTMCWLGMGKLLETQLAPELLFSVRGERGAVMQFFPWTHRTRQLRKIR